MVEVFHGTIIFISSSTVVFFRIPKLSISTPKTPGDTNAGSFPVRSEYYLTESGLGLIDVIKHLKVWALKYKIDNIDCGNQNCKDCIL